MFLFEGSSSSRLNQPFMSYQITHVIHEKTSDKVGHEDMFEKWVITTVNTITVDIFQGSPITSPSSDGVDAVLAIFFAE